MIDLGRNLLDRPLDPRHARAILAVASCLTLTFAALVGLGLFAGSRPTPHETGDAGSSGRPTAPSAVPAEGSPDDPGEGSRHPTTRRRRRQDPQDRRGTGAYRRARRTMREHRALQHLPFHANGLSITLTGADRGRAVIRITAPTIAEARRRWHGFLRRYGDGGTAYEARFALRPIAGKRRGQG